MTTDTTAERRRRVTLAFPAYTAHDYATMRAAATDAEWLHESAEHYDRANQQRRRDLSAAGFAVEMVLVSAAELIAWCKAERVPLDSRARHRFTMRMFALRERQAGHA